jgi:hypothetical protein
MRIIAVSCHHQGATSFQVNKPDGFTERAYETAVRAIWSHKLGEARRQGNPVPDGMVFCQPIKAAEEAERRRYIRDIFGNPFRPLPPRKGKRAWQDQ